MFTLRESLTSRLMIAGAISLVALSACSDDPTSNDQATVTMQAELASSSVTLIKGTKAPGAEVDSIKVNRIRLFVRRMKLHRSSADTTGNRDVKTEPFVVTFSDQPTTFASLAIPPGSYDKVKFEFHRAESSQITEYLGIADFVDFVTDGRHSAIYDLTLYKDGAPMTFAYRSDMTANLSLDFAQPIDLTAGTATTIALEVDPSDVFKEGASVLDPRDEKNESDIDNNIKAAIKLHKH